MEAGEGIYVPGDGGHNFDSRETGPGRLMVALLIAVMTPPPAPSNDTSRRVTTRIELNAGIVPEIAGDRISIVVTFCDVFFYLDFDLALRCICHPCRTLFKLSLS